MQKILFIFTVLFISFTNLSCQTEEAAKELGENIAAKNSNEKEVEYIRQLDSLNLNIDVTRHNAITMAVAKTSPAVVGINVTEVKTVEYRNSFFDDPFFRRFFGGRPRTRTKQYEVQGLGSGFLISSDGYILTNHHVAGEASKIVVTMTDGSKHDAKIIGSDRVTDVALLKIEGEDFPFLKLSNSDNALTGEWVIAFGNPFGLFKYNAKPTVTVGVISNMGINMLNEGRVYKGMIQTDAAISSGNSGGPLVNALGEVIGMNTIIFSTAQDRKGAGSIGIGFSIPINRVKKIVNMIKEDREINRNFITGIEVRDIDDRIARYLESDVKEGAVIFSISRRTPAEKAGFEPGDIVLSVSGEEVNSAEDYYLMVKDACAGQELEIEILRANDKMKMKLYLKPM